MTPSPNSAERGEPIIFWYRNYRGEEGYRRVIPRSIRFGASEYHDDEQWLMLAFDTEKNADREFAMRDMKGFVGNSTVLAATPPATLDVRVREALETAIEAVFNGWLERFEHGDPILYTPAREFAADAVRDCRDLVLAALSTQPAGVIQGSIATKRATDPEVSSRTETGGGDA